MLRKPYFRKNLDRFREENDVNHKKVISLPLCDLSPNPDQPRIHFDEVDIVSLADSIRQHGLLQPITVRLAEIGEAVDKPYVIVAGERRFRAMKMLAREEIAAIIVDISAHEAAELAIIENIMRKDLSMFELSEALKLLIERYSMTQESLARRLSTSQSNIANKLRLLRFSVKERCLIEEYSLTERHARAILRIPTESARMKCLVFVGERRLSVKATEQYIDSLLMPKPKNARTNIRFLTTEAANFLYTYLKKPLLRMEKRGISVVSEQVEDEDAVRIVISIPKSKKDEADEPIAAMAIDASDVSRET